MAQLKSPATILARDSVWASQAIQRAAEQALYWQADADKLATDIAAQFGMDKAQMDYLILVQVMMLQEGQTFQREERMAA